MDKSLSEKELLTKNIFKQLDEHAAATAKTYAKIMKKVADHLGTSDYLSKLIDESIMEKNTDNYDGKQNTINESHKDFGEIIYSPEKNIVTFCNVCEEDLSKDFIEFVLKKCNIPKDVTIKFKN